MNLSVLTLARTLPLHFVGGLEESSWNLARTLARVGVGETILTTSFDGKARVTHQDGVEIHEIPYVDDRLRNRPTYRWWPHFAFAAARYVRERAMKADVIHSQSLYVDGFLRWPRRPPIAVTMHGTPRGDYVGGARDKLIDEVGWAHPRVLLQHLDVIRNTRRVRRQLKRVEAIVPVSRHVAEILPGVDRPDPRVRIIPNGINPSDFPLVDHADARSRLDLPADGHVLLYVGRIEKSKGVHRLVDLVSAQPDLVLLVAGEGPYLSALRERIASRHVQARVRLLGRIREERPTIYAAADLVCLPSLHEGQPISLVEAMAEGTPVATSHPWIPDELLPYAAIEPDADGMVRAGLALAEQTNRMEVREAVLSRFTWDRIAESYVGLFEHLAVGSSNPTSGS